jgi:enoyl-CoA hydratase
MEDPMELECIAYEKKGRIARVTLNRPEKLNAIRPPLPAELERAIAAANADKEVRVIVLQGAGSSFCAGFDFSENLEHFTGWTMDPADAWDPGRDMQAVLSPFTGPVPKLMSVFHSPKPVIAKVHGWCVGGGSELALLSDVVIASHDARFGTPYSRVWGCHLVGMWIYRLGITRAKHYALTGESISGKEAAEIGLINFAYPLEELEAEVQRYADRLASIPTSQLVAMKLITNQTLHNMGLQSTHQLGSILDGYMRNIPEAKAFVERAGKEGVSAAVAGRDGPFKDYSTGDASMKPRRR